MATLTILIMIGALYMGTAQDTTDQCLYRYDIQPGPMTKSFNQSIASNDTLLILCCQVSSKLNAPDFVIQWHQSATIPIATNKTSANENTAIEETDRAEMTVNSRKIVWSKLRIDTLTYKESDGGYFWCSVNNDNNTFIPSYVLNISSIENVQLQTCGCDDGLIVVDNTQFYSRCANSDVHIINDIQSDKCPQGEDGKLSQSTNATEDLWTTASSQIDINNGSTIQEVKGLTTLPTKAPNNDKSTTHHTNVQITNEKIYEDITQATSAADTKWLTTAETSKKGQLESVMMSFTIGISTGAILIFILSLITGVCIMKLSKMRSKRQKQEAEQAITISMPVDVYNMATKTKLVRKASIVSSSFICEPNTSYDVTPGMIRAPSLEHVYDCIP